MPKVKFRCTGCDTVKEANAPDKPGQRVTYHNCSECGEETKWVETGWVEIEVE